MTTYAPNQTDLLLEELGEREREAWNAYRDNLRDLGGRAYDDAESTAWDELQRTLRDVATERAELSATTTTDA